MDLPPVGTVAPAWTAGRIIRLVLGVVIALLGGVLGLTLIVGFVLHPEALERTFDDGTPTWPFQLGWVLVNAGIAVVGVRIARSRPRVRVRREPIAQPVVAERVPGRRVAPRPSWTVRAAIRLTIGILLLPVGVFVIVAAIGLIATAGWDYLFASAPNEASGDSNLGVIITLAIVGVMIALGGWSLIIDRHKPRASSASE